MMFDAKNIGVALVGLSLLLAGFSLQLIEVSTEYSKGKPGQERTVENNSGFAKNRSGFLSTPCWERCIVLDTTVICSNIHCTSIPKEIDNRTTKLLMRNSDLGNLTRDSFDHLWNLEYLDMSSSKIQTIQSGTFDKLTRLTFLNLSFNPQAIYPGDVFQPLTSLQEIHLTRSRLSCTFNSSFMTNWSSLTKFWFGMNRLTMFPKFTDDNNATMLPNIRELNLDDNSIERIEQQYLVGLTTLEILSLKGNRLFTLLKYAFSTVPQLQVLELDRNYNLCPHFKAFKSNSLRSLSVTQNRPFGVCSQVLFAGLGKLRSLNISYSKSVFRSAYPFDRTRKLIYFSARGVGLTDALLPKMIRNLQYLRFLDLSENDLSVLTSSSLQDLTLESLVIRENWISVINVTTFSRTTWNNLKQLDVSDNAFYCDCDIVWFRRWLRHNKDTAVLNTNRTRCVGPGAAKDIPINRLPQPTDLECFSTEDDPCLLAVFLLSSLVALISAAVSVLHKFRWVLKYWYFTYKTRAKTYRELLDNRHYNFDAFISYCATDLKWVTDHLRPRLENDFNLRLCIHDRDWMLGRDIVDNVVDSINHSRRTVLVVSNAFAASQWCHFEMTIAQTKDYEDDRDSLILILLEEIADCNMNPRLQLQMQKKTYIEWTDNHVGQQLFWVKLRQAIARTTRPLTRSTPPRELFNSTER